MQQFFRGMGRVVCFCLFVDPAPVVAAFLRAVACILIGCSLVVRHSRSEDSDGAAAHTLATRSGVLEEWLSVGGPFLLSFSPSKSYCSEGGGGTARI